MLSSQEFWERVAGENVLVVQTDTALCANPTMSLDDLVAKSYGIAIAHARQMYEKFPFCFDR